MNVCLYPDLDNKSGLGHINRLILLTKFFDKFKIYFLYKENYDIELKKKITIGRFINYKTYQKKYFKYTIVDNYRLNSNELCKLKKNSNFLILIYDLKQCIEHVDFIIHSSNKPILNLDQKRQINFFKLNLFKKNISFVRKKYINLTLFISADSKISPYKKIIYEIMRIKKYFKKITIIFINNNHKEKISLKVLCSNFKNYQFIDNPVDMMNIYKNSDIFIGGYGQSLIERLNFPIINLCYLSSKNQINNQQHLKNNELVIDFKLKKSDLHKKILFSLDLLTKYRIKNRLNRCFNNFNQISNFDKFAKKLL